MLNTHNREMITKNQVICAMKTFDPYKSAASDGINTAMQQNSLDSTAEISVDIFQDKCP